MVREAFTTKVRLIETTSLYHRTHRTVQCENTLLQLRLERRRLSFPDRH